MEGSEEDVVVVEGLEGDWWGEAVGDVDILVVEKLGGWERVGIWGLLGLVVE